MQQPIVIEHTRVFDGLQSISDTSVLIQDGKIAAIGRDIAVPPNTRVIDGSGHTLLPGLIDAHTHVFGPVLQEALVFGVTTELDMFMDHNTAAEIKRQQAAGEALDMADLRSAGTLVTAPGGHGTEYGLPIPTITSPLEAQEFVDARIAEGSDYIKIIYDDGRTYGRTIPTIDKATMEAVVEAAHVRDKLAVVHVLSLREARDAIDAGADGLAHLFTDEAPDEHFGRFVADHTMFVIPTLTVLESVNGIASGKVLSTDPQFDPYLSKWSIASLKAAFPVSRPSRYTIAEKTIRLLKAAGVPILAGTDAPNPGTSHGISIHRELELLVQAGLTPSEALAAATSVPAAIFGLHDRGRIAPGLRADLVLVKGDPTADITVTHAITDVWKQGVRVDRETYRANIEQQRKEDAERKGPTGSESGLVSDFSDGTLKTLFGAGWDVTTDSVRGGDSKAQHEVVPEGANGGKGSLLISGEVGSAFPFGWAGSAFYPGITQWAPTNLSEKKGLSFWAKGDGGTYRVMIFAGSLASIPPTVTFVADAQWKHFTFSFSDFGEIDTHELMSVLFVAGPTPGPFTFQIDEVRFYQ